MYIFANRDTQIISGFPAIGKSHFNKNTDKYALDNDSSLFSHNYIGGDKHPDFPNNYMRHIENNIGRVHYMLVSTHKEVRDALNERKIDYTIVYPSIELKDEYIERMKARGNNKQLIKTVSDNWEKFITDIEAETHPKLIKLESGQFLSDVLSDEPKQELKLDDIIGSQC